MLEIRHLRTLSALRSAGSLVRAAQLLNLTQSALSHQIKLLEDRYGGPLFERKSVPIGFTATGARLLKLADLLLPEIETAEREVARLTQGDTGQLRVALECPTCFDWLMPVLDEFRKRWPEVEIDLVSGFHGEPEELLRSGEADLAIGASCGADFTTFPLFRYETLVVMAQKHRLAAQRRLQAADFEGETLITYPMPAQRVDLIREVLAPANIHFQRRSAELTVAVLQLVASRRGIAALPNWAIKNYIEYDYVIARPVGEHGLWSELYVSVPPAQQHKAYVLDFVNVIREQCASSLDGIKLLS
ncbi:MULTISPECIES: LysR family transcriptional regulator [unclassified Duganella]|jgi:LysR family transcriptional regulator for metE and metH|uniref:LysR family transcriptional regulator n=1 Tax=unclassified Duganella TaxID=2636909 RepID=UPI00088DE5C7|nr:MULTISPECIES: LysR family transcriptional regulator [unclassified Duganella]SDG92824.1 LysR family transcriptional regulator, regulator for metE and metH [Duganella sp. OV458]SDJ49553.1 transcriptional regulator, LysR family [Duganella sp. OV510]